MNTAEQNLDFLRYKGRTFIEVPGLKLWLWKQLDKAEREDFAEGAEVLRSIIHVIERDSP